MKIQITELAKFEELNLSETTEITGGNSFEKLPTTDSILFEQKIPISNVAGTVLSGVDLRAATITFLNVGVDSNLQPFYFVSATSPGGAGIGRFF